MVPYVVTLPRGIFAAMLQTHSKKVSVVPMWFSLAGDVRIIRACKQRPHPFAL
jgi:hypothetical protein